MVSPSVMQQVRTMLESWESRFPRMYLDSNGLVTVGCGTLLPSAQFATTIPFFNRRTLRASSIVDIKLAWNQVHGGSPAQRAAAPRHKHVAGFYENLTDIRISPFTANQFRDRHVEADYIQLKLTYPTSTPFRKRCRSRCLIWPITSVRDMALPLTTARRDYAST